MRSARRTTLPALPAPRAHGPLRGPHIPDTALPCRRRPDVFQHPVLDNAQSDDQVPGNPPESRRQQLVLLRTARDLCASCPLWAECLQDAVAHAEPHGYAAATTRDDRRLMRRTLGIGDAAGDLPVRGPDGVDDPGRRLTRLRSLTTDAIRHPADHGLPTLEQILDAFDLIQDERARLPRQAPAVEWLHQHTPAQLPTDRHTHAHIHTHPRRAPGHPGATGPTESGNQHMAAADAGQRIAFSYDDPARAVRHTLLGPLVRTALPALASLEQLVTMLSCLPGGEALPAAPHEIRTVRDAVAALLPDGPDADGAAGAARPLTGSVCVDLATTDPVAALRRDVLDPLLRELTASLANIDKVATMLAAAEDGDEDRLATIRTAARSLRAHLPAPPPAGATEAGGTGLAALPAPRRRPAAVPSIRAAVEEAVTAFQGPFSARDVLRALPPGVYGDPSKTISNVLSALVKSGRLRRLARGTYAHAEGMAPRSA